MAIAAVPGYLQGRDFSSASPGLRFGMYLQLWGVDDKSGAVTWATHDTRYKESGREKAERIDKHENKRDAINHALKLTPADAATMAALLKRQIWLAAPLVNQGQVLALSAVGTAPFTTGLGNEHPLENGFAFLNPYGLPYLPGSGVKGVLRQAARELASGEWGDSQGWSAQAITDLFGLQTENGDTTQQRGALTFWDVLPQLQGKSLQVDVMTPHQSHYYQQRREGRSGDSTSPHDSGQPNPIHFVVVPPGTEFTFHVQSNPALLKLAEARTGAPLPWQALLQAAFEHAFEWMGFGAKTAVGYGAMAEDARTRSRHEEVQAEARRKAESDALQASLASMAPADRAWTEAQAEIAAFQAAFALAKKAPFNPGGPFAGLRLAFLKTALEWTEERSRRAAADALEQSATKAWGRPSNKERWTELQSAIATLRGPA